MCLHCIEKISHCSIKSCGRTLVGPCMAYTSIGIKPYIKSHLDLQRKIPVIELAPSPYFFVLSICLAYMNMFARFSENPAMTLQDIKKTKRYGRAHALTNARTNGQRENSIPTTNKFCGGNLTKFSLLSFCQKLFF